MKVPKKRKLKKRLKEMSVGDKTNKSVLRNVEVAGILSEIHPIAAGVYNHAYFVIIQERKHGVKPQPGTEIIIITKGRSVLIWYLIPYSRRSSISGELPGEREPDGKLPEAEVHLQRAHHSLPHRQNLPHSL